MQLEILEKLSIYLSNQDKLIVTLTFNEIESIIEERLPSEAKEIPKWWWNIKGSKKAEFWMKAGYSTFDCKLIQLRGAVTFKKNKFEIAEEKNYFKKLWYFLTDKDATSHQKMIALLEVLILPLIALLTLIMSFFPETITTQNFYISGDYYENDKISTYSFENVRDFDFPDKPFMEAKFFYLSGEYEKAYSLITDSMNNYKQALNVINNEFARLDDIGAERCLFYGLICEKLNKTDEIIEYFEICYIYYRNKIENYCTPDDMYNMTYVTYSLTTNYFYLSQNYEKSIFMLKDILSFLELMQEEDEAIEMRNVLALIYSKTGRWEEAVILFANTIFPYTVEYSDIVLPENTQINVFRMPINETPVIDFLTSAPMFVVTDEDYDDFTILDLYAEEIHPDYFENAFSNEETKKQVADFRKARIYMMIFSTLEFKEDLSQSEILKIVIAYSNLANTMLEEFGYCSNIPMYSAKAARMLEQLELTSENKINFAMTYATLADSYLMLVQNNFVEESEEVMIDLNWNNFETGIEYHNRSMDLFYELLEKSPEDPMLLSSLATVNLNIASRLSLIDKSYNEISLMMYAKAYQGFKDTNISYANMALEGFNNLYKEMHPIKYFFGGAEKYLEKANKKEMIIPRDSYHESILWISSIRALDTNSPPVSTAPKSGTHSSRIDYCLNCFSLMLTSPA